MMYTTMINSLQAYEMIENSKGKIFAATFIKRDGTLRRMVARKGVNSKVTGKGLAFSPESKLLIPVYDMQAHDYRMINLGTLQTLKMNRTRYTVQGFIKL